MDLFARLPIDVLHHILSSLTTTTTTITSKQSTHPTTVRTPWLTQFVYTKQDVQTCILSKTFLHAWSTIPDLNFFHDPKQDSKSEEEKARFVNYLNQTLTRYQHHNIVIRSLSITANVEDDDNFAYFLNQWIHKAEEYGVTEIYLDLKFVPYSFDLHSLFSLKKLVSLRLFHCSLFKGGKDYEVLPVTINCSSLKTLVLGQVGINQWFIDKLLCCCPLIEQLQIRFCNGPTDIKVANLPNLKCLEVMTASNHDQTVDINAQSLELLMYYQTDPSFSYYLPSIESTRNLRGLNLQESTITDGQFHNLIANCPVLEELILDNCTLLKNIEVSSHSLCYLSLISCDHLTEVKIDAPILTEFELISCEELIEVKIDAPILTEFEYVGDSFLPSLAFTSGDSQKRRSSVTLSLECLGENFLWLREFLKAFKSSDNISLTTSISYGMIKSDKDNINDLRDDNSIIPEFELVYLVVTSPSLSAYSNLMERLLASFSPKILAVKKDEGENFVKYLCKELLLAEDDNPNRSTCPPQSWRNYFGQAKLEGINEKWLPLHSLKNTEDVLENLRDWNIVKLYRA